LQVMVQVKQYKTISYLLANFLVIYLKFVQNLAITIIYRSPHVPTSICLLPYLIENKLKSNFEMPNESNKL
jgi:hypothetical protein